MVAVVIPPKKQLLPTTIRVVYEKDGRKVVCESGMDVNGGPYQTWLDYRNGTLSRKTVITNGKVQKTVFSTRFPGDVLYTQNIKMTPNGRQVTEEGWTGKHGYFSLKMPSGHRFAHFGPFVIDEWNTSDGRIREIRIDKNDKYHLVKRTVQCKGKAPEILDESKERKQARHSMHVIAGRSDLSAKEKWAKIREVVMRYRQQTM